ncbi:MAG: UvrD-helicase domain-containing protein [Candidatus Buchananbacteria bacterium]
MKKSIVSQLIRGLKIKKDICYNIFMSQLLEKLNTEQAEAVSHDKGPLLIVAGAGTGKTTVITHRIAYLINSGKCNSEEILALTFTDKAAGEMEERVDRLLPYGYVDLWISTFHSFAERILKEHGLEIGLPNDFKLLNSTQQWLLIRKNLDKFDLDYYRPLGNPTKFIHALLKHFSRAKDENISASEYLEYVQSLKLDNDNCNFISGSLNEKEIKALSKEDLEELTAIEIKKQSEIADAYHVYQKLLLDSNALDFGDLINYCLKLFSTRKNLLLKYRSQFKYILIDEFQDTNLAQYELIKLLSAPVNNITVVGDDDQSVYKFRGASVSNILQFKDDFPESKEILLNQNYRSAQEILDLSYKFICQNNPNRLEVKLAKNGKTLSKRLLASSKDQAEIAHLHGDNLQDEINLTVNKIIELYNKNPDPRWSDFAILVRANSGAEDFIYAFEKAKVPYNFCASKGLYSKKIIINLLCYLKLLDNHHESPAMYRIVSMPLWQLSHQDIVNLNYFANRKGWSLFEVLNEVGLCKNISADGLAKITLILAQLKRGAQMVREGKKATEIMQEFLNSSGYLKSLTATDSADNLEQINYLNQFFKKTKEFEKENPDNSLRVFMEMINLEIESGEEGSINQNVEDSSPNVVKIMTVHAAKGLEFKYVFIVNMVDKRFPAIERSEPIELPAKLVKEIIPEGDIHLQEERRLFYVAMTRAKGGLYFTSATDYGGARDKKLSRFLIELEELGLSLAKESKRDKNEYEKITNKSAQEIKRELLPQKFSFTQIKAFESCPYQYRFAHILKIPTSGKPVFSFGKTMHSTLQKFIALALSRKNSKQIDLFGQESKNASAPSLAELIKIYEESFIDDWYPTKQIKEEYFNKGKVALKMFYENYVSNLPDVINLEYGFNLKIGDYGLRGVMDRVDKLGEGIKIVDYKTGKAKDKLTSEDKEQLLIYQIAAETVLKKKVNELSFYYLEEGREESFLGTEKELAKVKEKVIKIIDEIRKGYFPANPSELCKYCDFNSICEFRK